MEIDAVEYQDMRVSACSCGTRHSPPKRRADQGRQSRKRVNNILTDAWTVESYCDEWMNKVQVHRNKNLSVVPTSQLHVYFAPDSRQVLVWRAVTSLVAQFCPSVLVIFTIFISSSQFGKFHLYSPNLLKIIPIRDACESCKVSRWEWDQLIRCQI